MIDQPVDEEGFKAGFFYISKKHMFVTSLELSLLQPLCFVRCDHKNINISPYCFNNILETHGIYHCFNGIACKINGILQSKVAPKNFFVRQIHI